MKARRWVLEATGIVFFFGLLVTLTGCVGYVDADGGGVAVIAPPPPDVVVFGGDYDRGHDEHSYSHRGYESRHENDEHGHDH